MGNSYQMALFRTFHSTTPHRSVKNCMVNILAGLAAYVFQEKKPALKHLYTPLGKINIAI